MISKFSGLIIVLLISSSAFALPKDFVYLHDATPSIIQDMRYASYHNFVGRPITGYRAAECILTRQAAHQLAAVQRELLQSNLSLKVFDCYRPQRAVDDFIQWSKLKDQQQMKQEFYPRVDKSQFFKLDYVAAKSGHSRGSTVDLTVVPIPTYAAETYHRGQKLVACTAPYRKRFYDSGIDMGTGYDCFSPKSHPMTGKVSTAAYANRMLLRNIMIKHGFKPLPSEWWHFTLVKEPFPDKYFNFEIEPIKIPRA